MNSLTVNNNQDDTHSPSLPDAAATVEHGSNSQEGEARTEVHDTNEHTLYAEPVFNIGNFTVTNSLVTSWVAVAIIIALSLVIRAKNSKIPGVFQSMFENIIEGALNMMDLVTNDRAKSQRVFPLIFAIFAFVLVNNWMGLLPGIGSVTFNGTPLFRGATADLNTTLGLGLLAVVAANIFGVMAVGGWNYFNKFVNVRALLEIPGKIKEDWTVIIVNPIMFFVGILEIIGELAKVASLSFRLFGNVFAGEVLIASIAALVAYGMPLPFMFLEVLVGIIQALIISILTLVYFTIASTEHAH